jgi:hypothetical protein
VTLPPDLAVRHAWRGALVAAGLNAVGMPGDLLLARDIPNMPWYPDVICALVGAVLVVLLLVRRHRATVRLGSVAFLINAAAILVTLWITSGYWASTPSWMPFQANKLGALAVPLLAPQLSVGLASIAGYVGVAIGKFYVLDPGIQRGFNPARLPGRGALDHPGLRRVCRRAPRLPPARSGPREGALTCARRGGGRRAHRADVPEPA